MKLPCILLWLHDGQHLLVANLRLGGELWRLLRLVGDLWLGGELRRLLRLVSNLGLGGELRWLLSKIQRT